MDRFRELLAYTAVDREFFESYGQHALEPADFDDVVRRQLPAGWAMHRSGPWVHASPRGAQLPTQGWKIHVSSVLPTARIVLAIATAILVANRVAFKFAGDLKLLGAINGKRWPRGGAGKFITVYAADVRTFRRLLDDLAAALSGYAGPYVLTDRRHPDCAIVSYRYGGIAGEFMVDASGGRQWLLRRPDGGTEPDDRQPRYRVPDWVVDPLGSEIAGGSPSPLLGGGRFRPLKALGFSSAGGIYLADDVAEGRRVILKEARPYIGAGELATASLRKEFRLLRRLAHLDVAPRPIAHFREWEHSFLAEAWLEGDTLRGWLARRYPWLRARATRADVVAYLEALCPVFESFAETLALVHDEGISMGDLSFHNCIVDTSGKVRLIDLETAVEDGLDKVADAWTPGFAAPRASRRTHADAVAEDRYAFGANLFAACLPANAMLPLDPAARDRFMRGFEEDLGLPGAMRSVVAQLMQDDALKRPDPRDAMARLRDAVGSMKGGPDAVPHRVTPALPTPGLADRLFAYLDARATTPRPDRYVPAGPEIFETHPYGIAHGAAGILHAYQRTGREQPASLLPWLRRGLRTHAGRGAGLAGGDAGIAWTLFDAHEDDLAVSLLRASPMEGAVAACASLGAGMAGWGLARLRAWYATDDPAFLDDAVAAADALLAQAQRVPGHAYWPVEGRQPLGLAHGASGIAIFLLHVFVATGLHDYLQAARDAVAFDLGKQVANMEGDPSWPAWVDGPTLLPYLRTGTAGVVAALVRLYAVTGDAGYRDAVLATEHDLMRRHAISPGFFDGLAGIGETLLDLATWLPERAPAYRDAAMRIACGIEPFLVERPEGLAVPGTELVRLSCDLATGNAGVAMFLDRLAHGGNASFLLDEHLPAGHDAL